jgi:hypothetical protein
MRDVVEGTIVEQGVAWLRHARDEACVGVEAGVEENGRWGAACPHEAGLEHCVGMIVDEDAGSAWAEDGG